MNTVHRKRYTPEFKAQAGELLGTGKPVSQVAQELCMSSNLLLQLEAQRAGHATRQRIPGGSRSIADAKFEPAIVLVEPL